jgi:hypothetical protein
MNFLNFKLNVKVKRSLIVLSILLVIAIIALPLINKAGKQNLTEKKDFAVKNVETIDSIFIANRSGEYILLRKQEDNVWTVNNSFKAAPDKIERLLKTMRKIEAKNPVGQAAQKQVVASLATNGKKVEVFQNGEKTITYYVGGTTADETGTFMYIEGSTIPFVVHIPGFRGYLSSRYSIKPSEWRDKAIFDTPLDKFAAVAVSYPDSAEKSFEITREQGNTFTVSQKGVPAPKTNQAKVKPYVAQFAKVTFETYLSGYSQNYIDSLRDEATPKCVINIKRTDGSTAKLTVYYKPVTSDTKSIYDKDGNLLVYDTDNYFALIEGNPELITVQDYIFRHIFKDYQYFIE